ncbi:MAG: hypothetical protein IJ461_05900 [Clostridia bacterium]|nr:hypothetical protein [Clostridia bacterium]
MEKIYKDMRTMALTLTPKDVGVTLDNEKQVYAAVADLRVKGGLASLFCAFDGTVSLYYSTGGGMLGLGEKEPIRKAAMSFLVSAGQCLPGVEKVKAFPAETECIQVYLLAKEGLYRQKITCTPHDSREAQFLNFLVQNVLKAIRENAEQMVKG